MNKYIKVFIVLLLLVLLKNSFAWDSTAAKFYPLAVGNLWSYHRVDLGMMGNSCMIVISVTDYITRVVSDTLMPNGKRYFKIQGPASFPERIDSTSMNVYRYIGGGECLVDSLLARINDNYNSCRSLPSQNLAQHLVMDTNAVSLFGLTLRSKFIQGNQLISHRYRIVEKLGLQYERACEFGGAEITLNGCIINGVQYGTIIGLNQIGEEFPTEFSLFQNYPNPFNPVTKIKFSIPLLRGVDTEGNRGVSVKLVVYDVLGREITTLVKEQLQPGIYEVEWSAANFPSGVYFYQLTTEDFIDTKPMVLIK